MKILLFCISLVYVNREETRLGPQNVALAKRQKTKEAEQKREKKKERKKPPLTAFQEAKVVKRLLHADAPQCASNAILMHAGYPE